MVERVIHLPAELQVNLFGETRILKDPRIEID